MRIDQITVQNFRCFEKLTLDLHPEFNVLIGENGAGKTVLLDALAISAGGWLRDIGGLPTRDIGPEDVRLIGRRVGHETTFEPQPPVSINTHGLIDSTNNYSTSWERISNEASSQDDRLNGLWPYAERIRHDVQHGKAVTLPVVAYYGIDRLCTHEDKKPVPLTQRELSRFEGYQDALTSQIETRELARWLEYQDRIAYQEKQESPVYHAVLEAMTGMIERATDVRFNARRLEIVVEFEGSEVHPFGQLSAGQRNLLALVGDIAMRMARLNPQFDADVLKETPGIVLIDELDLHLHPRWHRHIVADLRRTFPKVQFVTTTHSPQIVSETQPACVIVLTKEGDQIVAYKAHQAYGLDTNGVLQSLMDTRTRPFDAQKKIDAVDDAIEEGDLDQARHLVGDLRRMLHGDDSEVVRLDTSIYALEALADAVD